MWPWQTARRLHHSKLTVFERHPSTNKLEVESAYSNPEASPRGLGQSVYKHSKGLDAIRRRSVTGSDATGDAAAAAGLNQATHGAGVVMPAPSPGALSSAPSLAEVRGPAPTFSFQLHGGESAVM